MKTTNILLIFIFTSLNLFGQNDVIDKIFDKYSEKEGFAIVTITKYMFNMFKENENKTQSDVDFEKSVDGLESIRILSVNDSILNTKINLYKEIMKDLPINQYKELMVVKEKNQEFKMLIKEQNKVITEFLMIGGGKDNVLICITGRINLNAIKKLSKTMKIDALDNLDKVKTEPKNK